MCNEEAAGDERLLLLQRLYEEHKLLSVKTALLHHYLNECTHTRVMWPEANVNISHE